MLRLHREGRAFKDWAWTDRAWTDQHLIGNVAANHLKLNLDAALFRMPDDMTEHDAILAELSPPFEIVRPAVQTAPFVFCSPHSGRIYPSVLRAASRLDARSLRKSEDCYVDQLFSTVAELGAPLISARFPRAYLDVNREPYELDPELFGRPLPNYANSQSMRVAGGLGTIARIVADSEEIYLPNRRPTLSDGLTRIELLYRPFHAALAALIRETQSAFGYAVLIDCHSMPSQAPVASGPSAHSPNQSAQTQSTRPQIVLGDRFGASCDSKVTRMTREALSEIGLETHLNRPYAGGFITEHYGRPFKGVHALQIEINRALYLDETTLEQTAGFVELRAQLASVIGRLFQQLPNQLERRWAAE
jgi:N-formylglutamate amidohydrolase